MSNKGSRLFAYDFTGKLLMSGADPIEKVMVQKDILVVTMYDGSQREIKLN